jgi:hypothetical protein
MTDHVLLLSPTEVAVRALAAALSQRGLRVERSFDLRLALEAHRECECPYHGTSDCPCQLVVLLAYGKNGVPVAVTAHSYGPETTLKLIEAEAPEEARDVVEGVRAALLEVSAPQKKSPTRYGT